MQRKWLQIAGILAVASVLFTVLVAVVDVEPIGPFDSKVGFAALNGAVHSLLGANRFFYYVSSVLGLIPLLTVPAFAALGVLQLVLRRSIRRADRALLALAAFYALVALVYLFFEVVVINCRPVLEDGILEASYPSSHTLFAISLLGAGVLTAERLAGVPLRLDALRPAAGTLAAVIIVARLLSGVHWLTDILGGVLIGCTLVVAFAAALDAFVPRKE